MRYFRQELKASRLFPILELDYFLSHRLRHLCLKILQAIFIILASLMSFFVFLPRFADLAVYAPLVQDLMPVVVGLLFLVSGGWLVFFLLETFFRHYYLSWREDPAKDLVDFPIGKMLYAARDRDPLLIFLKNKLGQEILWRAGLPLDGLPDFFKERAHKKDFPPLIISPGKYLTLLDWPQTLSKENPDFQQFILTRGVRTEDFIGAATWVLGVAAAERERERWWSREQLGEIRGLAKDWSYGGAYELEKFSRDLTKEAVALSGLSLLSRQSTVAEMETILGRSAEANVLLVGDPGNDKLNLLLELAERIRSGRVTPPLEHKRLLVLESPRLLAAWSDRASFESGLVKLLNEARRAGNIILVFDDLPGLARAAAGWEINLAATLDPILSSSSLQVIALADTHNFQQVVEADAAFVARFEKIIVQSAPRNRIMELVLAAARRLEAREKIFFTYPAVLELLSGAETYFSDQSVLDKTVDLLTELAVWSKTYIRGRLIDRSAALQFLSQKVKIPLGEVAGAEKEKLLHLETILHKRVIGQEAAISAVSQALRRARAGIRDTRRPIGSFLFLGPTGVGKTETAKALGAVFFQDEGAFIRLDMSEYQTADALERLIGSFSGGKTGGLADLLRIKPYGVLLVDEFEKTTAEVRNLFLQILDEGFFSDAEGRRVNARNLLIVATSNAGAEFIWQLVKSGADPVAAKDRIIEQLISQGIFKPELLNRFDAVVVFHPLAESHLQSVGRLLLERLAARLKEKGIDLAITEELAATVAKSGADQAFGARPMSRFIADKLEEAVAKGIIAGEIKTGSRITFDSQLTIHHLK